MLDSTFSFPKPEKKVYDPIKKGSYPAQLTDISEKVWKEGEEPQLSFEFRILKEGENYGRKVWWNASKKMGLKPKKTNLCTILEELLGRTYTQEECLASYDEMTDPMFFELLLNKQLTLIISQAKKQDGGIKNKIEAFMPLETAMPPFDETKVQV